MSVELLNCDCMEYMKGCDDNSFDLAIVDPPYGIGASKMNLGFSASSRLDKKEWDGAPPKQEYFTELFRVSKNQIIWGGNYFNLPPARCFIIWDKGGSFKNRSFAECEQAWASFDKVARIRKIEALGVPDMRDKIHKTQKPISLYSWLLDNYAEPSQRILDTHLGSGSSAIAAHYFGCDFVGMEIAKDYFDAACERFDRETRQIGMGF